MNVIYVLWWRQLKHYWRSKPRVVGSLAQPLLFLFALGFGFSATFEKAGNGNYIQFLAPGIIAMAILFNAMFSGIDIIWDRQFGFLKETLVAPVTRTQIVIGRTLGGATVALIQGLVVGAICFIAGFRIDDPALLPLALLFMFLIALLFTAIGTAVGSALHDLQAFPLIMNFVMMPMFFLSGALFPVTNVPSALRAIINVNPASYGVDGLRGALTQSFAFGAGTDIAVLSVVAALLLALSSYAFSKIQI